jgi:hypothetical protein
MRNRPPETVFYVNINGEPTTLFKIRDPGPHSDGTPRDATILSGHAKLMEHEGDWIEFNDQHYSIHKRDNDQNTLINQKTRLKDGTSINLESIVLDTKAHLLWPLYARRVPKFETSIRKHKDRAKDKNIQIGDYNSELATIFYTIFVTRPNYIVPVSENETFKIYSTLFDKFKAVVLVSFLNIPTMGAGDVQIMTNKLGIINGIPQDGHTKNGGPSFPADAIIPLHFLLIESLRAKYMDRLKEKCEPAWFQEVSKPPIATQFTARPLLELP